MTIFSDAVKVEWAQQDGDVHTYAANIDKNWVIVSVPHGGYVLAVITEACIKHQEKTEAKDPIQLTAHFLTTTLKGPCEIRVHTIKTGKGFTNLTAELVQKDIVRVTCHAIFGTARAIPDDKARRMQMDPGTPYSRRHPLSTHPSKVEFLPFDAPVRFHEHLVRARDPLTGPLNTAAQFDKDQGSFVGQWMQFNDERDVIRPSAMPFFGDFVSAMVVMQEQEHNLIPGEWWFPSLMICIQWVAPIPHHSESPAPRTVAGYARSSFIYDPQGRHDNRVEIWTSPAEIGKGVEDKDWRDKQECLAVITSTALFVGGALNNKLGAKL